MDIKNLKQHVIGLLQLTSSTPVSTTASVHDQLGQLTIGSRNNTPDTNNNIRRGRSLERRASPSNTLNLIAHLKFSLEELRGSQILQMAIDKDNYQVLKRTVEHGNNVEINYVFEKLKGYIPKLCHNSYGSQVIIQLLNLRHYEKIRQVFSLVLPELVNLCYEPNGAAVIEKLVECVAEPEQITELFCALMTQLLGLSQNGYSHKYFMNTVLENCMALGTDKNGCCVLQKCLQHGSAIARHRLVEEWPNKIFDAIAKVIENNHSTLDCNMYGKRVINCLTKLRTERRSSYRLANLKEPSNI
ncbi:hypothetical protein Sjap_022708 [Stephania japonica]|uniref:PUM-HD domain-containing protein n=1 Tax=Stephania japonica TaxID=461633 RepID=A0AAP0EPX2_9MAGN